MDRIKWKIRLAILVICFGLQTETVSTMVVHNFIKRSLSEHTIPHNKVDNVDGFSKNLAKRQVSGAQNDFHHEMNSNHSNEPMDRSHQNRSQLELGFVHDSGNNELDQGVEENLPEIPDSNSNGDELVEPEQIPNVPDSRSLENEPTGFQSNGNEPGGFQTSDNGPRDFWNHENEPVSSEENNNGVPSEENQNLDGGTDNSVRLDDLVNNHDENEEERPGEIPILTDTDTDEHLEPDSHGSRHDGSIETGETSQSSNENGDLAPGGIPYIPDVNRNQNEHVQSGFHDNRNEQTEPGERENAQSNEHSHVVPDMPAFHHREEEHLEPVENPEHGNNHGNQNESQQHSHGVAQVPENVSEPQYLGNDVMTHLKSTKPMETEAVEPTELLPVTVRQITPTPTVPATSVQEQTTHELLSSYSEMSSSSLQTTMLNQNLPSIHQETPWISEIVTVHPSSVFENLDHTVLGKQDSSLNKDRKISSDISLLENLVSSTRIVPEEIINPSKSLTESSQYYMSASSVHYVTASVAPFHTAEHQPGYTTAATSQSRSSATGNRASTSSGSNTTARKSGSSTLRSTTLTGESQYPATQPAASGSSRSNISSVWRTQPTVSSTLRALRTSLLTGEVVSLPSVTHEIVIHENTTSAHAMLPLPTTKKYNESRNNTTVTPTTEKPNGKRTAEPTRLLSTILHRRVTTTQSTRSSYPTSAGTQLNTLNLPTTHSTHHLKSTKLPLTTANPQTGTARRNSTIHENDSRIHSTTISARTSPTASVAAPTSVLNHTRQTTPVVITHTLRIFTTLPHSVTQSTHGSRMSTSSTSPRTETTRKTSIPHPALPFHTSARPHHSTSSTGSSASPVTTITAPVIAVTSNLRTVSAGNTASGQSSSQITEKWRPTPVYQPPVFATVKLHMTWNEFCVKESKFRLELVDIFRKHAQCDIETRQIMFVNINIPDCVNILSPVNLAEDIDLKMYLVNIRGQYDITLTITCCKVIFRGFSDRKKSYFKDKLMEVSLNRPLELATPPSEKEGLATEPGIIIAIVIASVGGLCCISLIMLQVIIRRRYAKTTQSFPSSSRHCSFTSTDSIALGSVNKARPNSGLINPGLDLTSLIEPSVPLTLTALANKCLDVTSLYEEFQTIPNYTPRLSTVPPGAEDKNRYANVIPIPHTRVRLKKLEGQPVSDYINANYITGYEDDKRAYIATQAPMTNTIHDFWRMVWEQQCRVIIMLTAMDEHGHPKCAAYWPDSENDPLKRCGDYIIVLKKKDVYEEYTVSCLELKDIENNLVREVKHFWYTCWPTHGIPEPISLVKFLLDTRPYYEDSGAPLIVHCSPGTGRTGTVITLDICMRQMENKRLVDVLGCVHQMRQERAGVIQTKEQYSLIYMALNEYACLLTTPAISAASSVATLQTLR